MKRLCFSCHCCLLWSTFYARSGGCQGLLHPPSLVFSWILGNAQGATAFTAQSCIHRAWLPCLCSSCELKVVLNGLSEAQVAVPGADLASKLFFTEDNDIIIPGCQLSNSKLFYFLRSWKCFPSLQNRLALAWSLSLPLRTEAIYCHKICTQLLTS